MTVDHFRLLADYNRLANARLYAVCGELPEAELKRRRPAFFGSIHGTLNHILLGDRIWLARFAGETVPSTGLDAILYEDFRTLREARAAEDARIVAFVDRLAPADLEATVAYVNNEGRAFTDRVGLLLAHLFNHQTHHRGQVHDMLSATALPPPVLDLHRVLHPQP